MKTKCWMPWTIAVVAHAGLVWVLSSQPWTFAELASADFIAADGPFSISTEVDLRIAKSAVCEVHLVPMSEDFVPVVSAPPVRGGMAVEPEADPGVPEHVRAKLFPHSLRDVPGVLAVGDVGEARVHICPECRRAEERWLATNRVAGSSRH